MAEGFAASGKKTRKGMIGRLAQRIIGRVGVTSAQSIISVIWAASAKAIFAISLPYSRNNVCTGGSFYLDFPSWKQGVQYTFFSESHGESPIFMKSYLNLYRITHD